MICLLIQVLLLVSLLATVCQAADVTFTNDALTATNNYRSQHGAPPLTISPSVRIYTLIFPYTCNNVYK